MATLRPHFCVVRYDTRGHGASGVTPGPYTIEQLGRDVVALLDHLGTERASFCGLSLGGMTGMWLGIHAPRAHRQARARQHGRAHRARRPVEPAHRQGERGRHRRDLRRGARALVHAGSSAAREPETLARMKAMMERQPAAGYVACCAAVRDMDQREDGRAHRGADARHHRHARCVHAARRRRVPRRADRGRAARRASRGAPVQHRGGGGVQRRAHVVSRRRRRHERSRPARCRHEGAAGGAGRRARRPHDQEPQRLQRGVPGPHHALRVGRDLDPPRAAAAHAQPHRRSR